MFNELNSIVKKMSGAVLTIGFDPREKFLELLHDNDAVTELFSLTNKGGEEKGFKLFKHKKVKGSKIYRKFKRKKIQNIIVDYSEIKWRKNKFIKNSINLAQEKIYFFIPASYKIDEDELCKRFRRYGATITKKHDNNKTMLTINVKNAFQ